MAEKREPAPEVEAPSPAILVRGYLLISIPCFLWNRRIAAHVRSFEWVGTYTSKR